MGQHQKKALICQVNHIEFSEVRRDEIGHPVDCEEESEDDAEGEVEDGHAAVGVVLPLRSVKVAGAIVAELELGGVDPRQLHGSISTVIFQSSQRVEICFSACGLRM